MIVEIVKSCEKGGEQGGRGTNGDAWCQKVHNAMAVESPTFRHGPMEEPVCLPLA